MSINITTDNNTVTVTSTTTNKVNIVDNGNNTSVSVSQPTTRVIKVATVGPQGPVGPAGVIPNTGSFATTGSNSFIGNQNIQGDLAISGSDNANSALRFLSGASVTTLGSNIDMTAGPGGWSELGSNNGQNYVWVDDNGLNLVTNWDGNTITSAWRIATGSRQLTAVGSLNMNGYSILSASNIPTTGSNKFTGSQYIQGDGTFSSALNLGSGYALSFVDLGQTPYAWIEGSSYDASYSFIKFMAGGNEAFRITSAGRLGIGKSIPNATLDVTGSAIITGSFISTGSSAFIGPQIVTGSTRGNVTALSISSNTASIDLSAGNFFTLQLVAGTNTYINPSNILPGQTSILTVSTIGSATVSFPSYVKQPSGSAYIPTTTTGVDILTLASVNTSSLYIVGIKNMI